MVLCVCQCGKKTKAVASDLMRGYPRSCGHLKPGPKTKKKAAGRKIKPVKAIKPVVTKDAAKVQKEAVLKPAARTKAQKPNTDYLEKRRKLKSGVK